MTMTSTDIREDELNSALSLAIQQTQIVMLENIEDDLNGKNNARREINSNEAYFVEFVDNFQALISTDTKYKLLAYYIDYEKGIISVGAEGTYHTILGTERVISSRKTSIIDLPA